MRLPPNHKKNLKVKKIHTRRKSRRVRQETVVRNTRKKKNDLKPLKSERKKTLLKSIVRERRHKKTQKRWGKREGQAQYEKKRRISEATSLSCLNA